MADLLQNDPCRRTTLRPVQTVADDALTTGRRG